MIPCPGLTAVISPLELRENATSPYDFHVPRGNDFSFITELTAKARRSPDARSLVNPSTDVRMSAIPRISIVLSQERDSAACEKKVWKFIFAYYYAIYIHSLCNKCLCLVFCHHRSISLLITTSLSNIIIAVVEAKRISKRRRSACPFHKLV